MEQPMKAKEDAGGQSRLTDRLEVVIDPHIVTKETSWGSVSYYDGPELPIANLSTIPADVLAQVLADMNDPRSIPSSPVSPQERKEGEL